MNILLTNFSCYVNRHFGKVYRAKNKQTGDTVAIKIIPLAEDEEDSMKKLKKEINLIQNCDSEYVVQYLDSHRQGNELWVILIFFIIIYMFSSFIFVFKCFFFIVIYLLYLIDCNGVL